MRTRVFWGFLLLVFLAAFNTACQRHDDNVQAAREAGVSRPAGDDKVLTAADRGIATGIEQSHLGELDLARLAKARASNGDVKDFADMLVDDHGKALDDISGILKDKNAMDASAAAKPAEAQAEMEKLQTMSGVAFDREFVAAMVTGHRKTLDKLNQDLASVQNRDLKDYVNGLTKKVEHHLEKGQELQTKLMAGGK